MEEMVKTQEGRQKITENIVKWIEENYKKHNIVLCSATG
jgi:hypothetical protein